MVRHSSVESCLPPQKMNLLQYHLMFVIPAAIGKFCSTDADCGAAANWQCMIKTDCANGTCGCKTEKAGAACGE